MLALYCIIFAFCAYYYLHYIYPVYLIIIVQCFVDWTKFNNICSHSIRLVLIVNLCYGGLYGLYEIFIEYQNRCKVVSLSWLVFTQYKLYSFFFFSWFRKNTHSKLIVETFMWSHIKGLCVVTIITYLTFVDVNSVWHLCCTELLSFISSKFFIFSFQSYQNLSPLRRP